MFYTYNNKYYIIRPGKLVEITGKYNENGELYLAPTKNEVDITPEITYSYISVEDVKKNLSNKGKEVKEEVKVNSYVPNKKINKFNKTI